jgi:hypothetical protein
VITFNVANDRTRRDSKFWGGPVSLHKTTSEDVATTRPLPDVAYVVSLLYVEGGLNSSYCGFNVAELMEFFFRFVGIIYVSFNKMAIR